MGAKRISLAAGFEDLLGTLRGTAGDLPSEGEMGAVSGERRGIAIDYHEGLRASGESISRRIKKLDQQLEIAEKSMREAIAQQRATEDQAAEILRRLLAELEGLHTDVAGGPEPGQSTAGKAQGKKVTPGEEW